MNFIGRKISCCRLGIKSIKRRHRYKGSYFDGHFKVECVRDQPPTVSIKAVISAQYYIITQKIIQPESNRQFKSLRWQVFDRVFTRVVKYTVKRQPQVTCLINKIHFNAALHSLIDDLAEG